MFDSQSVLSTSGGDTPMLTRSLNAEYILNQVARSTLPELSYKKNKAKADFTDVTFAKKDTK